MQRVKAGLTALAVLLVLAGALFVLAVPTVAQSGTTGFTNVRILYDLTVGDDATVADDFTTADLYASKQTVQVVSAGGTITPTGMYHPISSTVATGTSSVVGVSTAGRLVTSINVGSNTITLTDTGTLKLAGNAALGQYGNITLLSDGTNWIQLAKSDNWRLFVTTM